MRTALVLVLAAAGAPCFGGQPSKEVIRACVGDGSVSARVKYTEIPVHKISETEDEDTKRTEITIHYGKDDFGIWQSSSPEAFGLVYNENEIPLSSVARLSAEEPVAFNPSLAMWALIAEGTQSYLCISFNFDGLGRSGSFQSVRGVYLIDRADRLFRPFYTVGRTTRDGVVYLARDPHVTVTGP